MTKETDRDNMPEYPRRKSLRLKNYDYASEGYYFLTICTKDKKHLLSEIVSESDGTARVRLLPYGVIAESYIRSIPGLDKYVIMPNHIHMILHKTNGKSIASDVRSFKGLTVKNIGERIWQDSYYDHVIRSEKDYLEKWRYIDENPIRWTNDEYNSQGGMRAARPRPRSP